MLLFRKLFFIVLILFLLVGDEPFEYFDLVKSVSFWLVPFGDLFVFIIFHTKMAFFLNYYILTFIKLNEFYSN